MMAITKILRRRGRVDQLLSYATNPDKTDDGVRTAALHCTLPNAASEMQAVRQHFGKEGGTQAFHIIQSFSPGEISPEDALALAETLAQELFADFQVVIGTHCDRAHIHNHIVVNAVSFSDGRKYHSTAQSYRELRALSDRLCRERGLSVLPEKSGAQGSLSYAEWRVQQSGGKTLHQIAEEDVQEVFSYALDCGSFFALLEGKGYEVRHGSSLALRPHGYGHFFRMRLNGESLTEDALRARLMGALSDPRSKVLVPQSFRPHPLPRIGILGIYRHWLYVLGCTGQRRGPRTSVPLRAELRRFEAYKAQHRYLAEHGILTQEDLQRRMESLETALQKREKSRTICNAQKKRRAKLYAALATVEQFSSVADLLAAGVLGTDAERAAYIEAQGLLHGQDVEALSQEKNILYDRLATLHAEMRALRREKRLCKTIADTAPRLQERLDTIAAEQTPHRIHHRTKEE